MPSPRLKSKPLRGWENTTIAAAAFSSKYPTDSIVHAPNQTEWHLTSKLSDGAGWEPTIAPDRSQHGVKHGFLTLKVQLALNSKSVSIAPTPRPGESVEPPVVQIQEKWVDADYPARSGLKARLEAAGCSLAWAWDSKLAELELKGWETVIEPDAQGVLTKFRFDEVGPHQTLLKKKN